MTYWTDTPYEFGLSDRSAFSRKAFPHAISGAVALTLSMLVGGWILYVRSTETSYQTPEVIATIEQAPAVVPAVTRSVYGALPAGSVVVAGVPNRAPPGTPAALLDTDGYIALLDPTYSLDASPVSLGQNAPLVANFEAAPSAHPTQVAKAEDVVPVPVGKPTFTEADQDIPLPARRPAEFDVAVSHSPLHALARQLAQNRTTVVRAAPTDRRSFFEKLFGAPQQPNGPELAYAAPEDGVASDTRRIAVPAVSYDKQTAIYDISSHTVYLPDGTRLEAHSGLGGALDDPRYVAERMRGPTPPGVYDLQLRESLFHGVQALRLIPTNDANVYGRTGLLAHTFMLGPNGDSNGCVSFRDYGAFLRAYASGQVRRLTVVARLN